MKYLVGVNFCLLLFLVVAVVVRTCTCCAVPCLALDMFTDELLCIELWNR